MVRVAALVFLLTGCGYFVDSRGSRPVAGSRVFSQSELTYANVKQRLFGMRCEGCHGARNPAQGLDLSSYERLVANRALIERTVFREKSMPPRGAAVGARDLSLLRAWLDAGMPRGAEGAEGPEAPVERADFAYIRDVLFGRHACFACHAPGRFPADIPLNTVEELTQGSFAVVVPGRPSESRLLEILETTGRSRMPPVASDPGLSPEEIKLIRDWIERGAKAAE